MQYKLIVGLEVHVELATESKMFCRCPADHFAKRPNTQVCPTCLGLPGALPYANEEAIKSTIKFGLALNSEIAKFSKFDRKHYFYPDLPKAYQISQYDLPLCSNGSFQQIRIRRVHLEEDTAKLQHGEEGSLIDFNRSGVPLMEMVTEPDFHSIEEIDRFLKEIQKIVRYLSISTADMEKGSMRLEANISLSKDESVPDYKVELKNINSFRFLKKALLAEVERQQELLNKGEKIPQETRGYDERTGKTVSQRTKEEAHDYRYFPEPDIPPMVFTDEYIEKIKDSLPELPQQKLKRYLSEFNLPENYASSVTETFEKAQVFEKAVALAKNKNISPKEIASFIVNQNAIENLGTAEKIVKKLYEVSKIEYATVSETENAVEEAVAKNPDLVAKYQAGKATLIGFFVGNVQKTLQGRGDAKLITKLLTDKLQNS